MTARGRGWLSSIDKLPDEAGEDVIWACQELYDNTREIGVIHAEFNARLAAKGIGPISRTAFYNKALRLSAAQRRMRESREMFVGLADQFTAEDVDEHTLILGEFIKTLIQELLVANTGKVDTKAVMELARAYQSTVSAQKVSADRRLTLDKDAKSKKDAEDAKAKAELTDAVKRVVKQQGASNDFAETILEAIGVTAPKAAP